MFLEGAVSFIVKIAGGAEGEEYADSGGELEGGGKGEGDGLATRCMVEFMAKKREI